MIGSLANIDIAEVCRKLLIIMAKMEFQQQNTGAIGYLFFTREVTA
jgi:hypothetical protein